MDPSTSSYRRSYDLPKPEAGLAEWTSKIKALQRQVDEDEEVEQKRLQEEIAASRLARQRRSAMYTQGTGTRSNTDLSKVDSPVRTTFNKQDHPKSQDDVLDTMDRQRHQEVALQKLMGSTSNMDGGGAERPSLPSSIEPLNSRAVSSPNQAKPEPISLAQFMGGRATGPRLKKHAAQQDAHDPTQFEQRTLQTIQAPHPIFGRGGVAMPGLAGTGREPGPSAKVETKPLVEEPRSPPLSQGPAGERERRLSTPGVARRYVERVEQSVVPQKTGSSAVGRDGARERTFSTPTGVPIAKKPSIPRLQATTPTVVNEVKQEGRAGMRDRTVSTPTGTPISKRAPSPQLEAPAQAKPEPSRRPVSYSPIPEGRPSPPSNGRHTLTSTKLPLSPPTTTSFASPQSIPRTSPPLSYTPPLHSPSSPGPKKSSIAVPSLARPLQPIPKPSIYGPQIPPSQNPSPAFLRPPSQKEPTPSLSRLQGRGFVSNMVKVSGRLESQFGGGSTSPGPGDKPKSGSGGKRASSVLDRWPAVSSSPTTTTPPIIQPKPIPMRKSRTIDPSMTASDTLPSVHEIRPTPTGRSLKSVPSLPSMSQSERSFPPTSIRVHDTGMTAKSAPLFSTEPDISGLGSSNTMISYIKPNKTGDAPPLPIVQPPRPSTAPPRDVDELGMRTQKSNGFKGQGDGGVAPSAGLPAPSSKPLSHPTKDRAKVRRKGKDTKSTGHERFKMEPTIPEEQIVSPPKLVTPLPQVLEPPTALISPKASPAITPPRVKELHNTPQPSAGPFESAAPRITDRWVGQNLIGVKPITPGRVSPQPPAERPKSQGMAMLGRQALPGLAIVPPSPVAPTPPEVKPSSPVPCRQKHGRIPSTGNRATVMDVAQVLNEHHIRETSSPSPSVPSPVSPVAVNHVSPEPEAPVLAILEVKVQDNSHPPLTPLERRKSHLEKHSIITLPPLLEEKTPAPSPAGTLVRPVGGARTLQESQTAPSLEVPESVSENFPPIQPPKAADTDLLTEQVAPTSVDATSESEVVYIEHVDRPLPAVDVDLILRQKVATYVPDPSERTVSVDVMAIVGTSATTLNTDISVFYDTEVLAIVHRSKSNVSGLVATKVWGWLGKRCKCGEREERKLQELAKRYGTSLVRVEQYSETPELLHVLGGQLALRQGTRARWSKENTTMHLVRYSSGCVFIDEHDLSVKNLCSGFSYCLSILDTFYVWHGRGSLPQERDACLAYAKSMAGSVAHVTELLEGETDDDEMFWMILGDQDYAKADYWKWRPSASPTDPRMWSMRSEEKTAVHLVSASNHDWAGGDFVAVIDCIWEFFVLVGAEARGRRHDIRLALSVANDMSARTAESKPFRPTVHVVILPSQLPLDLRLNFRHLDEILLNGGNVPDHMNILTVTEGLEHLRKTVWDKTTLGDRDMLPLGVHASALP